MQDILNSLTRTMIRNDWVFDDRGNRIGVPFEWVDGDKMGPIQKILTGPYAVLHAIAMYYEQYSTPAEIRTDDHDKIHLDLTERLQRMMLEIASFPGVEKRFAHNIFLTALARTQDYCFIKRYHPSLPSRPVHLDIGPGLGSHAFYSLPWLNSRYIGLEAVPFFYDVQRHVYRCLASEQIRYFDPIVAETMELPRETISQTIKQDQSYKLVHLPSWYSDCLDDRSVDLVTATFVLNEITPAGISWLLTHATRALREGGFFYIRDSFKNKPNRHGLKYDEVLLDMGFERVHHANVKNRVDMFGIPRAYRKTKHYVLSFEEFFEKYFGRLAVTIHGGEYMQNLADKKS